MTIRWGREKYAQNPGDFIKIFLGASMASGNSKWEILAWLNKNEATKGSDIWGKKFWVTSAGKQLKSGKKFATDEENTDLG